MPELRRLLFGQVAEQAKRWNACWRIVLQLGMATRVRHRLLPKRRLGVDYWSDIWFRLHKDKKQTCLAVRPLKPNKAAISYFSFKTSPCS